MPLTDHPAGDYRFLPGIAPYSCGVVSAPGFEIAHVTLHRPAPYGHGFDPAAMVKTFNAGSAMGTTLFGQPNFFSPNPISPYLSVPGTRWFARAAPGRMR